MSRKSAPSRAGGRWLRWTLIIFAALLILPIAQVGCVRAVNPPLTPLMLVREAEARINGKPAPPRRYAWIDFAQIPRPLLRCVLTSEDQRFFLHHGFDWKEMKIAQRDAERSGKPLRGASTISMQCARSLFLWQGRSWVRKGLEAYYTFWMELLLPKRRILELYANVIEMGDSVYGVEAAAQAHFGTSARGLKREQAALLAAILPNPRERNPRHPSPIVTARAARILRDEPALKVPL
ncbi:MAG: monofunctional biosynthetic peptidoglycan transglycosylase [Chthoniobacteraceae bacterium]